MARPDDSSEAPAKRRKDLASLGYLEQHAPFVCTKANPFQECHLSMLRSLYSDTSRDKPVGSKADDATAAALMLQHDGDKGKNLVVDDIWGSIRYFLEERNKVRHTREKSEDMEGALSVALSLERETEGDNVRSGATYSVPRCKKRRGNGLNIRVSHGQMQTQRSQFNGPLVEKDDSVLEDESWLLMTKILRRRRDASTARARTSASPFLPLLKTVQEIVAGLQVELANSVGAYAVRRRDDAMHEVIDGPLTLASDIGALPSPKRLPDGTKLYADFDAAAGELDDKNSDEQAISLLSNKIRLWQRLAHNLVVTMGSCD